MLPVTGHLGPENMTCNSDISIVLYTHFTQYYSFMLQ